MAIPTVFSSLNWSDDHVRMADAEGWGIFDCDSTGALEIQRISDLGVFENDTAARKHVADRAADGSSLHLTALCCLAKVIVEDQVNTTCLSPAEVAEDLESALTEYNRQGSACDSWQVDMVSQMTLLRCAC